MKNQLLKITLKGTCNREVVSGFVDRGKPLGVSLWEKGAWAHLGRCNLAYNGTSHVSL